MSNGGGGAIDNSGSLTVNACTFTNNTVAADQTGGAIQNSGQLIVSYSTFSGNSAFIAGGAIYSTSYSTLPALVIKNSTFAGNTGGQGGAIYNSGSMTMTNSTLSGNTGSGAGIFNFGLATGSNSILSGDTGGECAGPGCIDDTQDNWAYFLVSGAEKEINGVWDSGDITLTWSDSLGNQYSYTVEYGRGSTPAGIASTFGAGISNTYLPNSSAEGYGPLFLLEVYHGATIGPATITNPSKSFEVTQVYQTLLFSSNGNIVGPGATFSPLGSYGGPTQTMIPLPGSSAICAGSATGIAPGITTDQRGLANINTSYPGYSSKTPCVDAGSVQTNYAVGFTTQPPATVTATVPFAAAVELDESGSAFTASSVTIPLALTGEGALLNSSANTVAGVATYSSLSATIPGANDRLNANLPLNGTLSITAPSDSFNVIGLPTTTAASSQTVTYSPNAQGLTLTAQVTSAAQAVSTGNVTFTLHGGGSTVGTPVTSATVNNGLASAVYTLPAKTPVGVYTVSAVYNAGGPFATSSVATQTVTVRQAAPTISWAKPAALTYGTKLSSTQLDAKASANGIAVNGVYIYAPKTGTVLNAGAHLLTVTFAPTDATDYKDAIQSVELTVNKAAQQIVFAKIANQIYAPGLTITLKTTGGASGKPVVFSLLEGASRASIVGDELTIKEEGSFEVAANQAGDTNYDPAAQVIEKFIVARAGQTIKFDPPSTAAKGSTIQLKATASSGLPVSLAATGPAVLTGNSLKFTGTGTVTVTASQEGNMDYTPAPAVKKTIAINSN